MGAAGVAIAQVIYQSATGQAPTERMIAVLGRMILASSAAVIVLGPWYAIGLAVQRLLLGRVPAHVAASKSMTGGSAAAVAIAAVAWIGGEEDLVRALGLVPLLMAFVVPWAVLPSRASPTSGKTGK